MSDVAVCTLWPVCTYRSREDSEVGAPTTKWAFRRPEHHSRHVSTGRAYVTWTTSYTGTAQWRCVGKYMPMKIIYYIFVDPCILALLYQGTYSTSPRPKNFYATEAWPRKTVHVVSGTPLRLGVPLHVWVRLGCVSVIVWGLPNINLTLSCFRKTVVLGLSWGFFCNYVCMYACRPVTSSQSKLPRSWSTS